MKKLPSTALLLLLLLAGPRAAFGPAHAGAAHAFAPEADEIEIVDKRKEVKEALDALTKHVKRKGSEDREAVALVEKLGEEFGRSGPKDQKAIEKAVSKCLGVKRAEVEGRPDNRLFKAAAEALGPMGSLATKDLVKWIEHKNHKQDLVVQRALILSLGVTKDKKAIKPLTDLLQHPTAAVVAASAEALGEFEKMPSKVRKEIFYDLLKVLMALKSTMDAAVNDPTDVTRPRWDAIQSPIRTTLRRLSGAEKREPEAWQQWWNENKRSDWDEAA